MRISGWFNLTHRSGVFIVNFCTKTTVCTICQSGNDAATAMWQWLCHDSCCLITMCFHFSSRLIKGQRSRLRHRRSLIPRRPQPVSRLFRCTQRAVREPERGCYYWALLCLLRVIILSSSRSRSAPALVIKIFIYLIWKLLFTLIPNDFL